MYVCSFPLRRFACYGGQAAVKVYDAISSELYHMASLCVSVAQLDRALASEAKGRRFDSCQTRLFLARRSGPGETPLSFRLRRFACYGGQARSAHVIERAAPMSSRSAARDLNSRKCIRGGLRFLVVPLAFCSGVASEGHYLWRRFAPVACEGRSTKRTPPDTLLLWSRGASIC